MTSLLGRADPLAAVRDHLQPGSGPVRVAVVTGEAGIGKTSLADAVGTELRGAGWTIRWGRGSVDAAAPPFWLWEQALGHAVPREDDRFALFEELRGELAAQPPTLLVIDDAQWGDEPSLRALLHVVRHHRDGGVAVLLTLRTQDAAGTGWDLVGTELLREPGCRQTALAALAEGDALAVVQAAAGRALPDQVAGQACALAGGNPFFLQELGRSWRPDAPEALPVSITDVVRRRVSALSPLGQELLAAASVLGDVVDLAVAARLLDESTMALLPAVDEAVHAGLLRRSDATVRFAHGLVRSALEQDLPLQQLVQLHLRAAAALEELHADDLRPFQADLARHWCAAAVGGDREPGVRWAERAARTAQEALAWEESSRLYDLALTTGGSRLSAARRAELLLARAAVDVPAGRLAAAHAACREAVALADGRSDLVATAALTLEAIGQRTWDRDVRDWCRAALADDDLDRTTRARLLGRLTEASIYSGDWERAQQDSAAALALAEGERSDVAAEAVVAALKARQLALSGPEHSAERQQLADRMIELAVARARPSDELLGLLWRIDAHWEHGRLRDVATDVARLGWCVEQYRTPVSRWHLSVARAALAQARGELAEAERLGWEGFHILDAAGHPAGFGAFMSLLSNIGHHGGYHPMTVSPPGHAEHAGEVRGELFATIGPAMSLAESGRLAEAAELYARPGPPQTWDIPPYFELVALACGCLGASLLGRDDDVRWYRQRLQQWRGRHVVGGAGVASYMGPVELALGVAAAQLGELDAAEAELAEAARLCREVGAPGFAVEADCRLAEVLVRAGRPAAATALARAALPTARRLGMPPWEARLAALVQERDILSPREREVASLVAAGRSNKEVAAALVVSERTAENHVQNILRKLGLTNRTQVAAWMSTGTSTSPDGTAARGS